MVLKCKINKKILPEYEKEIYRKLKWFSYINKQKADSDMINKFEKKIGSSKKTIVVVGDWDEGNNFKRNNEPAICKRTKWLLRKRGYKVYL